jgi:hypothetical protein
MKARAKMRDRDRLGDEREEWIENHLGLEAESRYGVGMRILKMAAGQRLRRWRERRKNKGKEGRNQCCAVITVGSTYTHNLK